MNIQMLNFIQVFEINCPKMFKIDNEISIDVAKVFLLLRNL